jgi:hypothetical protein
MKFLRQCVVGNFKEIPFIKAGAKVLHIIFVYKLDGSYSLLAYYLKRTRYI